MGRRRRYLQAACTCAVLVLGALTMAAATNRHHTDTSDLPSLVVRAHRDAERVPKVALDVGDELFLHLYNKTGTKVERSDGSLAVEFNAPLWQGRVNGKTFPVRLFGPAIVLSSNAPRITILNNLPFQPPCSCGCTVGGDPTYCDACVNASVPSTFNPLGIFNGVHNLMHTNMHTHGLKVDPGANDIKTLDPCTKLYNTAGLCNNKVNPANIMCDIYSDNIFPAVLAGGMTATNTYFLPPSVPGTAWYHDHLHGSVAYLTATTNGAILTPDIRADQLFAPAKVPYYKDYMGVADWRDWDAASNNDPYASTWLQHKTWTEHGHYPHHKEWVVHNTKVWHKHASKSEMEDCNQFIELMNRFPNYAPDSEIIQFAGLWFRKNLDGTPSDDTHAFIACNALPPSPLICPLGLTGGEPNLENYNNPAGRDYVAVNNVIQPKLHLKAGRFKRWLLLSTFTMKWMDLTIHEFVPGKTTKFTRPTTSCKMWLLSHDGVYLERIPRFPQSANKTDPLTKGAKVNNVVLGPGNRADIFIKCEEPGTYALVSGAGPYNTNPACIATHCECVGGSINLPDQVTPWGNNFWRRKKLNAALLAVIEVEKTDEPVERDLKPEACRTRLELFEYTAVGTFPTAPAATQNQCFNLVNMGNGSACNVNGVLFGNITRQGQGLACLNEGSRQDWLYRGIDFHPFHLHETPVRSQKLPQCLNTKTTKTNFWKVGDWWDTIFIPVCQCKEPDCETMPTLFKATLFPSVPKDFATRNKKQLAVVADRFLKRYDLLNQQEFGSSKAANCDDRYSVLHCHHLSHEDEGCMAVVWWNCITQPTFQLCQDNNGVCPMMSDSQLAMLKKMTHKQFHDCLASGACQLP